uniref:Uncharacterized protein n=1 Tax=Oryza punctata TaxID=4537 RepID=A0A0E0LKJ2_ORYPU
MRANAELRLPTPPAACSPLGRDAPCRRCVAAPRVLQSRVPAAASPHRHMASRGAAEHHQRTVKSRIK